jgi:hypothetical protein
MESPNNIDPFKLPLLVCVIAVWGESYTQLFLKVALPAQLSSGNLGAFTNKASIFQIYTTSEDATTIRQSSVFKQLEQIMSVEFCIITKSSVNRYILMSSCHKKAIEYANKRSAALIFLTPDCIISDGSLAQVLTLLASGIRVISTVGLRLKLETVVSKLDNFFNPEKTIIDISSRELMKIALNALHPITLQHIWNETEKMIPNNLFWRAENEGLLGRCFHLHPLMVYSRRTMNFLSTIDRDFPLSACPDPNDHYVVIDSDEIFICELSTESREIDGTVKNGSIQELIHFSENQVNSNHRNNAVPHIMMHTGVKTTEIWNAASLESDSIMNEIFDALDRPILHLLIKNPTQLIGRLIRLGQEAEISGTLQSKKYIIMGRFALLFMKLYTKCVYILAAIGRRLVKLFQSRINHN